MGARTYVVVNVQEGSSKVHVPSSPAEGVAWKTIMTGVERTSLGLLRELQERVVLRQVHVAFPLLVEAAHFHLQTLSNTPPTRQLPH